MIYPCSLCGTPAEEPTLCLATVGECIGGRIVDTRVVRALICVACADALRQAAGRRGVPLDDARKETER